MTQPLSPDLITKLADVIEATTPATLFSVKPPFHRIRSQGVNGVEESLPSRMEPSRNRLFDIAPETAALSPVMTSDEDRLVVSYTLLIRIYYAEMSVVAGQGDPAFLEARMKLGDYIVLLRSIIMANIFTPDIVGASSIVDGGVVFSPGLLEWRLNVVQEELIV